MNRLDADLIIVGGGLGGIAAALAACDHGLRVILTEETDWVGGQVTVQGVPPDEHPWIEEFGCTRRYRDYRNRVRETYHRTMKFETPNHPINPGNGWVSKICHDPRVSVHVLQEMLMPYLLTNQLVLKRNTSLTGVKRKGKKVHEVYFDNSHQPLRASYFIDATETGEVLPLAEMDYVTGAEAKADTGEPHALDIPDPNDIQAFTFVLAMEYRENESHVIPKPGMYNFWKTFHPPIWPDKLLSFYAPNPITLETRRYTLFPEESGFSLWEYRRIYDQKQFLSPIPTGDITLMNWPQNDYFLGNIYDVPKNEKKKNIYQAKQLSLSLLYWLQTEAPRPDGKKGYPGLKLRTDIFETDDGLAKAPYIRESRRIKAEYTIVEQDVSPEFNEGKTGKLYEDRIGIGSYSIDLHPSMTGRSYVDVKALPYHIPLGALIPKDVDNVLAGCKNIGTTHITNGCYRLHPTEWNIGEACGALVAFCLKNQTDPKSVRKNKTLLKAFQNVLRQDGFELEWPREFYL
ncbi:MAG TPA: FAD-dependent oxidoreductase [Bacillus sp. (in: firmicutes)]|uniref:FAD-dependent oxidoreductase n=1 Tax=Bacillus litorisediminis TaxID=2922713 RepID=UPI001FAC1BC4|nr:FAD-dependent oxidoreductase [Bacillus litorisediminis]HWO76626.1 FAD-dependent oxidoreductase [Bacillus sp. (in: firmicutes)]